MKTIHSNIGGVEMPGAERFESLEPSSGKVMCVASKAAAQEVDQAVAAARDAAPNWQKTQPAERAAVIRKAADILVEEYGEEGEATRLKRLITSEVGKLPPEADIEVIESSDMVRYFADEAPSQLKDTALKLDEAMWPTKESVVRATPLGVVGVIKPWNYPLEVPLWGISAALVCGNSVVFKPSEHSPAVGLEIGRVFERAGLPPGVLNTILGDSETGSLLVEHSGVNMVSFTGSRAAGNDVAARCARSGKRFALELSGNDAAIVAADADLELASNGLLWGSLCNAGQVCVGVKRILALEEVADDLVALLRDKIGGLSIGLDVGPMISAEQRDLVHQQVTSTIDGGAQLLAGGSPIDSEGFFYAPTLLDKVPTHSTIFTEECFGPVVSVTRVKSIEDAIALANSSDYGLGASVWCGNRDLFERTALELQVGMVWQNDVNLAFPQAPWGGVKASGNGIDLSPWSLEDYISRKHICFEAGREQSRPWWYPYS